MKMMMMIIIMMNCFYGMVDRRKAFSLISSRDHCQRSSPSRISDTPRAGFEPAQNLSSGLAEWSCAVVITTTPRRHMCHYQNVSLHSEYSNHLYYKITVNIQKTFSQLVILRSLNVPYCIILPKTQSSLCFMMKFKSKAKFSGEGHEDISVYIFFY